MDNEGPVMFYKHELRELLHCAEFAPSPLLVFVSAFFQGIAATYFIINAFIFGALAAWRHTCTLMRRLHAAGGAFVHPSLPPPLLEAEHIGYWTGVAVAVLVMMVGVLLAIVKWPRLESRLEAARRKPAPQVGMLEGESVYFDARSRVDMSQ
ncbi:unnamed protein product [Cylicocyclus nassatus]|uniref:Uncharacterized protein n=1 Tax=Cylicocyclus nassatus TaxID=53992 RepID=A0AA36M4G1_CYLNA|nr:unnamed protein product [Cylicocyclus nassatus]